VGGEDPGGRGEKDRVSGGWLLLDATASPFLV
jgi:hypothetical protein